MTFDVDNDQTLLDWENGIAKSARATALGPYLPKEHKQLMLDIEERDLSVQTEFPTMHQSDVIAEGLRRYARDLKVVENGHLTQDQVEEACREYGSKIPEYDPFPDTVEAMRRLGKYFKLIPLTNVDNKSFDRTLKAALKDVKFDAVYTAEDIGSYKPDLRNFHYLLSHIKSDFGLEKEQLVHVAQSLHHDHGPAKQMDILSVWVDRKGVMGGNPEGGAERFGYQLKVNSLDELADIVDKALAKS
jgi:2-haloalkanoic acid dehalogenase type II